MPADQRGERCPIADLGKGWVSRLRKSKGLVERCLNPAAGLIGRLRYSQKFLLIGLVLIAPLVYVVVSYLGVQSRDTSFAVKEQVGVVYLRPATQLLDRVVDARAVAVRVAAHKSDPHRWPGPAPTSSRPSRRWTTCTTRARRSG